MEPSFEINEIYRVIRAEAGSLQALPDSLDTEALTRVIHALADCRGKIILSGCGTSGMAARKIAHSLCCVERPAQFLTPSDAVHGALGVLQKDDILILISKGGNTAELVKMIPACKTKGALLIAVSESADSTMAREAVIFLRIKVSAEPDPFNMLATASTLAVISVFDAICITLMKVTGYTKEQFAVIHPGGAVGERLLKKQE